MQIVKYDLRREMREFYLPPAGEIVTLKVPKMKFLMIDGKGAPEGTTFQESIQAMYGLAYTLKFRVKKTLGKDYPVMPLEGLWWMKGGGFDMTKRKEWLWTLMIMEPEFVTKALVQEAAEELRRKKNPAMLGKLRLEEFEEGPCVQTMHVGPYSAEPKTIAAMQEFMKANGYKMSGKHHEIYLGDPRRSAPSKLRTVIRHPVEKTKQD